MSSFRTSLRIARYSHTPSMLRSRYLALRKNNLIISDFEVREREIREFREFSDFLDSLISLNSLLSLLQK